MTRTSKLDEHAQSEDGYRLPPYEQVLERYKGKPHLFLNVKQGHGLIAASSFAAILELSGGASRGERSVTVAAVSFACSLCCCLFVYLKMNNAEDGVALRVWVDDNIFLHIMLLGPLSFWVGVAAVFFYMSKYAGWIIVLLTVVLFYYSHVKIGPIKPSPMADQKIPSPLTPGQPSDSAPNAEPGEQLGDDPGHPGDNL